MEECAAKMNETYGEGTVTIDIKDQYYNMKEKIDPNMHVIDLVLHAMQSCDVPPRVEPIRGGTDGAELTYKGLPCPNLGTGGHNFHSIYEYVCLEDMEKSSEILIEIVKQYGKVRFSS